jgi:hypothetical protein
MPPIFQAVRQVRSLPRILPFRKRCSASEISDLNKKSAVNANPTHARDAMDCIIGEMFSITLCKLPISRQIFETCASSFVVAVSPHGLRNLSRCLAFRRRKEAASGRPIQDPSQLKSPNCSRRFQKLAHPLRAIHPRYRIGHLFILSWRVTRPADSCTTGIS